MKETFLLFIISTIFTIGKSHIECYNCIDGRRANNIPSCSHFFSNPTTTCWNTDYCGKIVQVLNYHNFRQVIIYTCFDYDGNMGEKNVTDLYKAGLFDKGIKGPYNGMDMEIFLCKSTLCNSASSYSSMVLFVTSLLVSSFKFR